MLIKKILIGNENEAYIENRLNSGFNIFLSSDNNRGKTIVIQGMMYALGNEPTFPSPFNFHDYYFIVEIEINARIITICRKNDKFVVLDKGKLFLLDNTSEFKNYWSKSIRAMPVIVKNKKETIVDPVLFLQLYFVGQDDKTTSNILKKGYYNKTDFLNMLFSMGGVVSSVISDSNVKLLERDLKKKQIDLDYLSEKRKLMQDGKSYGEYFSKVSEQEEFEEILDRMEEINEINIELKKERNPILNKRLKWNNSIQELNSLNRNIEAGKLSCMNCGSEHITFSLSGDGIEFDVSTKEMRKDIIETIKSKIDSYNEEVEKIEFSIRKNMEILDELMCVEGVSLEVLLAHHKEFISIKDIDQEIIYKRNVIDKINEEIKLIKSGIQIDKHKKKELEQELINVLTDTYRSIDPDHKLSLFQLFTKSSQQYSGSEGTIFLLSRLYAYQIVFNHDYPIIVDSFRAEDLSTEKEERVLKVFNQIPNQKIFTTTLKKEEENKYLQYRFINVIDYSEVQAYKLLNKKDISEFKSKLSELSIKI